MFWLILLVSWDKITASPGFRRNRRLRKHLQHAEQKLAEVGWMVWHLLAGCCGAEFLKRPEDFPVRARRNIRCCILECRQTKERAGRIGRSDLL